MIIQKAAISDAKEILSLQKISYKSEADLYNNHCIPSMTETLEDMQNEFEHKTFLKSAADGNIVGIRDHMVHFRFIRDTGCKGILHENVYYTKNTDNKKSVHTKSCRRQRRKDQ
ncbi:MAG: hypothetical protein KGI27_03015 [Thaumarchaeota archaeon]|nr:hypothetical protein [Nitrososphaerota archaeon]